VEKILRAYIDEAEEVQLGALDDAAQARSESARSVTPAEAKKPDVEAEMKRIAAPGLPAAQHVVDDTAGLDEGPVHVEPAALADPAPDPEAESSPSVVFATENEVLDMGTNKTTAVDMSAGTRSPAPLPGPPLEEVTVEDLVAAQSAPSGPQDVTLGIVPSGNRPTMQLDTTPW